MVFSIQVCLFELEPLSHESEVKQTKNRPLRVLTTGWLLKNGPPFYIGFQLILIVLANSDEQMPYWLGLGDSFAVLYIAVTCLVQELC